MSDLQQLVADLEAATAAFVEAREEISYIQGGAENDIGGHFRAQIEEKARTTRIAFLAAQKALRDAVGPG